MKYLKIFLPLIILASCKPDHKALAENLAGYWEINEVYKDGELIKSYKVSGQVDYFEINDESEGFRKKLMPSLDGTFKTSDHVSTFKIEKDDVGLMLVYQNPDLSHKEWVKKASATELIIQNESGFKYIYKPFEPIKLEDD